MRHLRGRFGLLAILIGALAACSGSIEVNSRDDQRAHLAEIGAGPLATDFSPRCITNMRRASASFRGGTPSIQDGCACIAVRLERSGELTSDNIIKTKEAHARVVEENKAYMSTYTNRDTMRLPRGTTRRIKDLSRGIMSAHKHCDSFTLDGTPRSTDS